MRRAVKQLVYGLLYYSGAVSLYRWRRRHKITFVMVHGVMNPEESNWRPLRWQLDPRKLDEYLGVLSRAYEFISASEAVDMLSGKVPQRPNCLVFTIDDGYRNALTHMAPVLQKHGVTPLLFLVTDKLRDPQPFWFDLMDYWLQETGVNCITLAGEKIPFQNTSRKTGEASFRALMQAARRIFPNDAVRLRELGRVIDELKLRRPGPDKGAEIQSSALQWIAILSPDEVRECKRIGFEIGAHSVHHYRLTHIEPEAARAEITEAKQQIEHFLAEECRFFGYPEGARNRQVVEWVKDAGYSAAFSSESVGLPETDTVFDIPRIHLPENAGKAELLALVSGFAKSVMDAMENLRRLTSNRRSVTRSESRKEVRRETNTG